MAERAPTHEASSGPRLVRVFLALEMPEAVRAAMGEAQRMLRRRGDFPARWTRTDDAHLTLLFFGNVMVAHLPEIVAAMTPVAARHASLLLRLGDLGAFPSLDAPRVIWLGIGGHTGQLMALQRETMTAMTDVAGVVTDRKPFRPHLTLARVDAGRNRPGMNAVVAALARPLRVPPIAWDATRVVLMRTMPGGGHGGLRYTVLHTFPLAATTHLPGAE